jgi:hypothetical protein
MSNQEELLNWLENSFLVVEQGMTLEQAADTYDDMNGDNNLKTLIVAKGLVDS